jgi:hypothetical protein
VLQLNLQLGRGGAAIKRIRQIYRDEAARPIAPSGFTIK